MRRERDDLDVEVGKLRKQGEHLMEGGRSSASQTPSSSRRPGIRHRRRMTPASTSSAPRARSAAVSSASCWGSPSAGHRISIWTRNSMSTSWARRCRRCMLLETLRHGHRTMQLGCTRGTDPHRHAETRVRHGDRTHRPLAQVRRRSRRARGADRRDRDG
jgi:hypothetical protein